MAKFEFQAKDIRGQTISGAVDADSESQVRIMLRAQKLNPVKLVDLWA